MPSLKCAIAAAVAESLQAGDHSGARVKNEVATPVSDYGRAEEAQLCGSQSRTAGSARVAVNEAREARGPPQDLCR